MQSARRSSGRTKQEGTIIRAVVTRLVVLIWVLLVSSGGRGHGRRRRVKVSVAWLLRGIVIRGRGCGWSSGRVCRVMEPLIERGRHGSRARLVISLELFLKKQAGGRARCCVEGSAAHVAKCTAETLRTEKRNRKGVQKTRTQRVLSHSARQHTHTHSDCERESDSGESPTPVLRPGGAFPEQNQTLVRFKLHCWSQGQWSNWSERNCLPLKHRFLMNRSGVVRTFVLLFASNARRGPSVVSEGRRGWRLGCERSAQHVCDVTLTR